MSLLQPVSSAEKAVNNTTTTTQDLSAALPPHSAERLRLSDRFRFSDCEAAPRKDTRGVASNSEMRRTGKAEPFRTVRRQSRELFVLLQLNINNFPRLQILQEPNSLIVI